MNRTALTATGILIASGALLLAGTLSGCSGSENGANGSTASKSRTQTPSPFDCSKANDQGEWDEHNCDASPAPGGQGSEGEFFDYQSQFIDSNGEEHKGDTTWKVMLTSHECGLKKIKNGTLNYDTSPDAPPYLDTKPEEGNEFCILTWQWTNTDKRPDITKPAGDIMINDLEFAKSDEDSITSDTVSYQRYGKDPNRKVNPGSSLDRADVYQIPAGKDATAAWFPESNGVELSTILVKFI